MNRLSKNTALYRLSDVMPQVCGICGRKMKVRRGDMLDEAIATCAKCGIERSVSVSVPE